MADNQRQDAESVPVYVIAIQTAMVKRADREALWHMKLYDVDLEAMAFEVAEALRLIDGRDGHDAYCEATSSEAFPGYGPCQCEQRHIDGGDNA